MKPTPETEAFIVSLYSNVVEATNGGKQLADFARKLERERDEWKASHDNQVNLRRMLMDRPDLKERAQLISKLIEGSKPLTQDELSHIRNVVEKSIPENLACSSAFGRVDGIVMKKLVARVVEDMELNRWGFTRLEQSRMDYSSVSNENKLLRSALNEAERVLSKQNKLISEIISNHTVGTTSAPANQGGQTV